MAETRGNGAKVDSNGVQSIEVGLALLKPLLDAAGPLTLKAIANAAGFAPPKAHRYLVSLIRSGLVERHPISGHYTLGPLSLELGFAALGMVDRDGWGRHAISELTLDTGVTCCNALWINDMVVVTAVEVGLGVIFTGARVGSRLSLLSSASGRLLLAYLPREITARAVAAEIADTKMSKQELNQTIAAIRRSGLSTVENSVMSGMSGLAAPVFDHQGDVIYTITMVGLTGKVDFSPDGKLAERARAKAADLSARLGYRV